MLMQVNVRDPQYTSQVEAVLAGKDFYSFVTQTQEDKSTLLREVKTLSFIFNISPWQYFLGRGGVGSHSEN